MANRSCRHRPVPAAVQPTVISEPEVHRWPHPIPQPYSPAPAESTLHYIRCALSYQNEMLGEIKALLEQIAAQTAGDGEQ